MQRRLLHVEGHAWLSMRVVGSVICWYFVRFSMSRYLMKADIGYAASAVTF